MNSKRLTIDKVMFVSSPGGHFTEIYDIAVGLNLQDSTFIVSGILNVDIEIKVLKAPQADRNLKVLNQFVFALNSMYRYRPKLIISTGAGIAVPFFVLAKLFKCTTIYIETPTAIYKPTLTCRIVQFFADRLYVRSKWLEAQVKNAIYLK
jgi:UDP-N-acetylglucosamine:LPS N-acetylglucosamine transferase